MEDLNGPGPGMLEQKLDRNCLVARVGGYSMYVFNDSSWKEIRIYLVLEKFLYHEYFKRILKLTLYTYCQNNY